MFLQMLLRCCVGTKARHVPARGTSFIAVRGYAFSGLRTNFKGALSRTPGRSGLAPRLHEIQA